MLLHAFHDASDKMISCLEEALGDRHSWPSKACKAHLAVLPEPPCRCSANSKIRVGRHLAGGTKFKSTRVARQPSKGDAVGKCRPLLQGVLPAPYCEEQLAEGPRDPAFRGKGRKICFAILAPGLLRLLRRGVAWSGPAGKRPRARQTAGLRALVFA